MNDYRAAAQDLQGQVLAAARKGQQRVAATVKNVTAAAQQIRPQLANLPKPTLNIAALPGQAQFREKAPALVAKLPTRLPANLQTKLPTADQIKAGAAELAGHARSVQRMVVGQVRSVATPIAHQAAARLAQVGAPDANSETTTRVSQVTVTASEKAQAAKAHATTAAGDKAHSDKAQTTRTARGGAAAKTRTRPATTTTRKPKAKPADE
jgi:hypothetical protein